MRDANLSANHSSNADSPMAGFWLRWRVITLIIAVVLALPAARQAYNWFDKSRDAREKQAARDRTRDALAKLEADQKAARDAARAELDRAAAAELALRKQFEDELQRARKLLEEKDFSVRLTGPEHVQPGAPNSWKIETLNQRGEAIKPRKLEIVVKDAKDEELFKETHEQPTGTASLNLPLSFWAKVKPGTELFLEVSALADDDRKGILSERIPLARPVFLTHLATDKPLYKPGETIRFRSLTLDRASLLPPDKDMHLMFRLRDPGDAVTPLGEGNSRVISGMQPLLGPDGQPLRGIGVGEYSIPETAPGGEYKLDLYEIIPDGPSRREVLLITRKFIVNRYVPDTFEKKLEFDGKSYGPGDAVQARVEVTRTAGGPMKHAKANVVATIDGREFYTLPGASFTLMPDADRGHTKAVLDVRFKLPGDLFEKNPVPGATLSVNIQDGSDTEAIVRPIPLVAKNLKVEFFPEGGEMIEGVPGRVYLMVRTPQNKPADLKGYITDGTNPIAEVATLTDAENPGVNRGHGIFSLTPEPGKHYFLKLTSPVGIVEPTKDGFPLPAAKADGVAMTALDAATEKGGPIRIRLQVGQGTKTLHLGAYARGRLVAHRKVVVAAGTPIDVSLQGGDTAGGVTRITAFEETKQEGEGRVTLIPRAERLVFRKLDQHLLLNVNPDKSRYTPAGKVKLELSACNEKEEPTPAVLLVAVVNRSVIAMADNKTDRLMPTHFMLSGEVRHSAELEHADFLLTDHPQAAVALDLLLGTQGWRRFAEQNDDPANPTDKPDVDRMLVAHGQRTSAPFALYKLEEQRVAARFRPNLEAAIIARSVAEENWNSRDGSPEAVAKFNEAQAAATVAQEEFEKVAAELYRYETRPTHPPSWGLPIMAVALCGLFIGFTALAFGQPSGSRRPYYFGSLLLFVLAGLASAGVAWSWATPETEMAWKKLNPDRKLPGEARQLEHANRVERPGGNNQLFDADPNAAQGGAGAIPPRAMPKAQAPMDPEQPAENKNDGRPRPVLQAAQPDNPAFKRERAEKALKQEEEQPRRRPGAGPFPGGMFPGMPAQDAIIMGGKGELASFPPVMPFFVREFAHERDPALGEVRSDFTETVYWHPVLVLPQSGKAYVEFQLSDDIARYQVLVAGHTLDGRIGAVTTMIEARQPFSLDPKLPLQVSHTDIIDVPLRVTNDSDTARKVAFNITAKGLKAEGALPDFLELNANKSGRQMLRLKPDMLSGPASVGLNGTSGPDRDSILRTIQVVPDGFPGVGSVSDMLENGRARGNITLPKDIVPGSLRVRLELYPTSMADLVKGLDGLLREPYGCFEQTSTSNYPNTLILDYMNQTNQANPTAAIRAKELLDKGYAKLISFECPDTPSKARQGFEWFGQQDNQHEALTAYGLLQFKDMARVHNVDAQMIKRTQTFLLSRKDGKGGFLRNARQLDSFGGAPKHTTDAYIVWALVESDPDDVEKLDLAKEIAAIKTEALDENTVGGKDSYFIALTANVLVLRGDRQAAHQLLDRLREKFTKNGAVTGAQTSITRSGGRDLEIETTALTLLGWMRANDPKYATAIKESTKWISQQRGGYGGFGSTQSTIMALKALTLFAKKSAHPAESGELKLLVSGKEVAVRKFTQNDVEVIGVDVENAETIFKPGESTEVEIATDAKQPYPFAVSYSYTTLTPISAEKCPVRVSTKLARAEANEGDTVPLAISLENKLKTGHGMTVAIIGIPAGMKVPTDMKQLTDLREKGKIAYFETRERELILYWRELAPEQKIELTVDLVCDVPGKYRGPASRAYLYYDADHKHWVEPLAVQIAPALEK